MKKKLALALVGLFMILQLVPVDRGGPVEPGQELQAPPEVAEILQRSCYDCHSAQTRWPLYSRVAPVSWWVADHVKEGREHLDFSRWQSYSAEERNELLEETWEEVEEAEMPLPSYLWMHRRARLSASDLATLKAWTGQR